LDFLLSSAFRNAVTGRTACQKASEKDPYEEFGQQEMPAYERTGKEQEHEWFPKTETTLV